jgi:hypothetical protein
MSRGATAGLERLGIPVALLVFFLPADALGANGESNDASADVVLEEILSTWKARANSIQTLKIRARFCRQGFAVKPRAPDEVAEILSKYGEFGDPVKELRHLAENLHTEELRGEPPWSEAEYAVDGQRTSERWGPQVRVSDGRLDVLAERDHGRS